MLSHSFPKKIVFLYQNKERWDVPVVAQEVELRKAVKIMEPVVLVDVIN
jgi:hypothetical protein